jgi:P4 family phage/plasmid primase-like protien
MSTSQRGERSTWRWLCWFTPAGDIDLAATLRTLPCSDLDAAEMIRSERPGELHFEPVTGHWRIWDGQCHREDSAGQAEWALTHFAQRYGQAVSECRKAVAARESAGLLSSGAELTEAQMKTAMKTAWEPWSAAEKYAASLARAGAAASLLKMLSWRCGTGPGLFEDAHPLMLNTPSGVLDIATGQMWPHDPAAMMGYCLDVPFTPAAGCPGTWALLWNVAGGSQAVAEYLVKVLGYCLLGDNREQLMFFISGPTASGKTALLDVVRGVLGPLAGSAQTNLITWQRQGRNARTEYSCRGRRLITITESGTTMALDEAQVKRLTGEREIAVDVHYSRTELIMKVTFTVITATNEMPSLLNFDAAMRRRVLVIPGGPTIPEALRDKALAERLVRDEGAGVLAMLVWGAQQYLRDGHLRPPAEVLLATDRYAAEQDTVSSWIEDCCQVVDPQSNGHVRGLLRPAAWESYVVHAGRRKLPKTVFLDQLSHTPGVVYNESTRRFEGLVIMDSEVWSR